MNSDEYAESVLTVQAPKYSVGIGEHDHAKITSILRSTREMIDTAKVLINNERTLKEGHDMLQQANDMFREVKDHFIRIQQHKQGQEQAAENSEDRREMLRNKYSTHDVAKTQEDEKREMDVVRRIYETMVTFPECIEQMFDVCLAIINEEIASLGLATIEVVVHEKRNANQEGYNKVVIVTNDLADRVKGQSGDGIVVYPFLWHDTQSGQRTVGVDGKWNCHEYTPEDCCGAIKQSVPNVDILGNNLECHIFVPFGGVGNPRRNDRVFITLSPDGRVQEAPIIQ